MIVGGLHLKIGGTNISILGFLIYLTITHLQPYQTTEVQFSNWKRKMILQSSFPL